MCMHSGKNSATPPPYYYQVTHTYSIVRTCDTWKRETFRVLLDYYYTNLIARGFPRILSCIIRNMAKGNTRRRSTLSTQHYDLIDGRQINRDYDSWRELVAYVVRIWLWIMQGGFEKILFLYCIIRLPVRIGTIKPFTVFL